MSNFISFEELERRKLLSVALVNGTLTVNGTESSDHITIYRSAVNPQRLHLKINGLIRGFDLSDVSSILVHARRGNDRVTIDQTNGALMVPTRLYGDFGNDKITGGSGRDRIYGGRGNDVLLGANGRDVIYGELGDDDCEGGNHADLVDGGAGDDKLRGGRGNDVVRGESGDDNCSGDDGQDEVTGGDGSDDFGEIDSQDEDTDQNGEDHQHEHEGENDDDNNDDGDNNNDEGIDGVVGTVNANSRTVTVKPEDATTTKNYSVDAKATIQVGGRSATLNDIKSGDEVEMKFATDGKTITSLIVQDNNDDGGHQD